MGDYRCLHLLFDGRYRINRIYIYASLTPASSRGEDLPRGVIVCTVEIYNCTGSPGDYHWHLRDPKPLSRPRKSVGKPQPVWFNPFPK